MALLRLHNTLHLTLSSPSPLFLSCIIPFVSLDPPFSTLCSQPHHYLSAAVTTLSSSGLQGICPSVPTSSSDEGSGVKKGRSRGGPITVQLQLHSSHRKTYRSGTEAMDREREKMTPPNPHLSCYWSIVLAGFVLFGTTPPSALI